jgi:hypothetical protein
VAGLCSSAASSNWHTDTMCQQGRGAASLSLDCDARENRLPNCKSPTCCCDV